MITLTSNLFSNTCRSILFLSFLVLLTTQCSKESADQEVGTIQSIDEQLDITLAVDLIAIEGFETDKKSHGNNSLDVINAALKCADFKSILFSGTKTIFAPTDAAFRELGLTADNICDKLDKETLRNILSYHLTDDHVERFQTGCLDMSDGNSAVLSREGRYGTSINNHNVRTIFSQRKSQYDLKVFMIDGVLEVPSGNLADVIADDKDLDLLSDAIAALPELRNLLSDNDGHFTVLAPTDRAFQNLLIQTRSQNISTLIDNLGADVVSQTIAYHVINDCLLEETINDGDALSTLQGAPLSYYRNGNGLRDETGEVSRFAFKGTDIIASNGVIHKINDMLNLDLSFANTGLNVREANTDVASVKASIINSLESIDAIGIAAQISHSSNAQRVGKELNDTELILFGNPRLGTPIMQANQQAGIDLPQKYLIYSDDDNVTRIAYNDIRYLKARHGLSDDIPTLGIMTNALNNFASSVSDRTAGPLADLPSAGDGLVDKISNQSIDDSYNAIVAAITNNPNLILIRELDHQANAARVGLELRPTKLIIFGNPNLGTPLMQSAQTVGIDLPQKILVWEDENQTVHISHNDPEYLKARHGIKGNDNILTTVSGALNNLTNLGAGI